MSIPVTEEQPGSDAIQSVHLFRQKPFDDQFSIVPDHVWNEYDRIENGIILKCIDRAMTPYSSVLAVVLS